jgi:hypothetical protein
VGKTVLVEEGEQRVIVRAGELVVVEHERAAKRGSCVVKPEHVAAFWKLCLPPHAPTPPAPPSWELTFAEGVATTPLGVYEAAAGLAEGVE